MCFASVSAAIPPLELKLRVRRYECVRVGDDAWAVDEWWVT